MQVNMLEAKNQLSRLVQAAENGEDVVIAKNGVPVVRLTLVCQSKGLKNWGRLKKLGSVDAAFSSSTEAKIRKLMEEK